MTTLAEIGSQARRAVEARRAADRSLVRALIRADRARDADGKRLYSRNQLADAARPAMSRPVVLDWLRAADAEQVARRALDDEGVTIDLRPKGRIAVYMRAGDEDRGHKLTERQKRDLWADTVRRLEAAGLVCVHSDEDRQDDDEFWPSSTWQMPAAYTVPGGPER